ncbi:MAG: cupin domain-containing protein [Gammaproteobacteria bacterium]|jgi:quercetin dioxygenase-like cupin family protein
MEPIPWNVDEDGELNETNMQAKLESMGYSVSRYVYPPGTYFPDHSHSEDKIDGVVSGEFMMRLEGQSIVLKAGDSLVVPRGVVHSAEVVGHQPVISLDAVKS